MPDKADFHIGQSFASGAQKSAEAIQMGASPESAAGSAGRDASPNTGGATASTAATIDKAKETISNVASQAGEKVSSRLDTQKDKAADGLGSVARALRQTGDQLRNEDQGSAVHEYISSAANQVERFSGYLRSTNTKEIVSGVERFARQQPALFVGAAFMLGVLGARFLKSSSSGGSGSAQTANPRGQGFPSRGSYDDTRTSGRGYSAAPSIAADEHTMDTEDYSPPPAMPPARGRGNF